MIRVALIGCGKIADQHAFQIQRISDAKIVATCDQEDLMARQLAERFQVKAIFSDISHMLAESRPDVVHITTPPQSHFVLGKRCLEAGCHVYIEKPFTVDVTEAEELLDIASHKGLKVTAGHNVQFGPEMLKMRKLVETGFLGGPPIHMESVFTYDLGDIRYVNALLGDKNHWVRKLPGKLLHNIISHGIANIAEFMDCDDPSVMVHGHASPIMKQSGENEIIDELRVIISDNVNTTAYFTFTSQIKPPVQEFRIFGPKNSLIVDNAHRAVVKLKGTNHKSYLTFFVPPLTMGKQYLKNFWSNIFQFLKADFHMDAGMKNLIEAFYDSIQNNSPPPISYREIRLIAIIMDKIFNQLNSHQSSKETVTNRLFTTAQAN